MWIASNLGYFSIVKKDEGYFVRARAEKDLELLKEATGIDAPILKLPNRDYLARIVVNESELTLIQRTLFSTITYGNFKDAVKANATQRDKVKYYTEVWGVMMDYQLGKNPVVYPPVTYTHLFDDDIYYDDIPEEDIEIIKPKKKKRKR